MIDVFSSLARQSAAGLKLMLVLTVITGILYPLAVWGMSRLPGLHTQAEGSIVQVHGVPVGSQLIGVDLVDPNAQANPTHDRYFHTRPSALSKDPLGPADPSTSGASNLAADNPALVKLIQQRKQAIAQREGIDAGQVPADAVTASASGLDPDISPAYASLQVHRVARENRLSEQQLRQIVVQHVTTRPVGVLGEPTVNVLELNLAVQQARQQH